MEKIFFNIPEAAVFTTLPESSLYKLTSQKKIPHTKIGKRVVFHRDDLIRWMKEQQVISKRTIDQNAALAAYLTNKPSFKHKIDKNEKA